VFGILSEPVGQVKGPLIVMVNGINEDHVGPSRLWVELSRYWAGFGLRCIRFDLQELGESPWLPGETDPPLFSPTQSQDIASALRALNAENPSDSVLVGLCSGARLALEVALDIKCRGVCMINPQVGSGLLRNADRMQKSEKETIRSFVKRCESLVLRHRWVGKTVWQISRLVLPNASTPRVRSRLLKNGTEMLLLASPDGLSPFPRIPIVGTLDLRRLTSSEHYRVELMPILDHDFLSDVGRARAVAILESHVLAMFAGVASSRTE
jgi:hypothetical protein